VRPAITWLCFAAVLSSCSRSVRREPTPELAAAAPDAAARQAAALDPEAGPPLSTREQIDHALSRLTFGGRPADRERVARVGVAAFIEEQLHPERIDDAPVAKQLAPIPVLHRSPADLTQELIRFRREKRDEKQAAATAMTSVVGMAPGPDDPAMDDPQAPDPNIGASAPSRAPRELRKQLGTAGRGPGLEMVAQLTQAKLLRAVASQRQLQEVMTDFWFNHFNVFAGKANEAALLPSYEQAIRERALGNFGDLLSATAHSPAMLVYLDNWRSSTPRPPRGRRGRRAPERGINENYARELLELHTLGVDGGYTQQDIVEVARCFTGWTIAEPQSDPRYVFRPGMHDPGVKHVLGYEIRAGGEDDGKQVLEILAQHPSTAHFIATKLVRRFVADDPPEAVVQRAADTFLRTGGDIRSVLRTIFESPEFWSRRALLAKVRSPLELVTGSVRALGARVSDPMALGRAIARIGEPLFAAQPPTGYVDAAESWLSPGAVLARIDFGLALADGQLDGVNVDLLALSKDARGPEEVLDRAAAQLGAPALSEKTREYVLAQLREAPPGPEVIAARAVGLLLGSPELQRR
jgi:uncharacterized protein (DUF1800 family)